LKLDKIRAEKNTLGDRHQQEVDILTTRLKAQSEAERMFYEHSATSREKAAEERAKEREDASKEREKDRELFYNRMRDAGRQTGEGSHGSSD